MPEDFYSLFIKNQVTCSNKAIIQVKDKVPGSEQGCHPCHVVIVCQILLFTGSG